MLVALVPRDLRDLADPGALEGPGVLAGLADPGVLAGLADPGALEGLAGRLVAAPLRL